MSESTASGSSPTGNVIHLQSSSPDPEPFVVLERAVATANSRLLRDLLQQEDGTEVPVSIESYHTIERVVDFFNNVAEDPAACCRVIPMPAPMLQIDNYLSTWQFRFFRSITTEDGHCSGLLDLLKAAHYLDAKVLLSTTAAYIASFIRGRSVLDESTRTRMCTFHTKEMVERDLAGTGRANFAATACTQPSHPDFIDPFSPEHVSPHVTGILIDYLIRGEDDLFGWMQVYPGLREAAVFAESAWNDGRLTLSINMNNWQDKERLQLVSTRSAAHPTQWITIDITSTIDRVAFDNVMAGCSFLHSAGKVRLAVAMQEVVKSSFKSFHFSMVASVLRMLLKVTHLSICVQFMKYRPFGVDRAANTDTLCAHLVKLMMFTPLKVVELDGVIRPTEDLLMLPELEELIVCDAEFDVDQLQQHWPDRIRVKKGISLQNERQDS